MESNLVLIITLCLIPFITTLLFLVYMTQKNKKVNQTFSEVYAELSNNYTTLQKQQTSLSTMYSDLSATNSELQINHEKAKLKITKLQESLKTANKALTVNKSSLTKTQNQLLQVSEVAQAFAQRLKIHGEILERVTEEETEVDGKKQKGNRYHFKSSQNTPIPQGVKSPPQGPTDFCNCTKPEIGVGERCKKCKKLLKK